MTEEELEIAKDAERLRRRHCDGKKRGEHHCHGCLIIKPGLFMLSCKLCGDLHANISEVAVMSEEDLG